jgi:hypothetical protein
LATIIDHVFELQDKKFNRGGCAESFPPSGRGGLIAKQWEGGFYSREFINYIFIQDMPGNEYHFKSPKYLMNNITTS